MGNDIPWNYEVREGEEISLGFYHYFKWNLVRNIPKSRGKRVEIQKMLTIFIIVAEEVDKNR